MVFPMMRRGDAPCISLNIWAWLMCWGGTPRIFEVCAKNGFVTSTRPCTSCALLDEPTAGLDNECTNSEGTRTPTWPRWWDRDLLHASTGGSRTRKSVVIIHNGQVRADGTPQVLEQTQTRHLEGAYVALTADVARPRQEDKPFPRSSW